MGASAGSAWVTCVEQMLPEHPLKLPWGWSLLSFAGFRSQEQHRLCPAPSSGSETSPAAFDAAVEAEWHREKRGEEEQEDPCTASQMMCAFCSQPRRCFCLVNQKNICVLLFQPAHQQTAAWPSLSVPAAVVFSSAGAVQMNLAVK